MTVLRRAGALVVVACLASGCSGGDSTDGCDTFREELAALEEVFDERDADGWDDIVELQEATLRRQALRAAIATGSC